jgi:hypothetical protein
LPGKLNPFPQALGSSSISEVFTQRTIADQNTPDRQIGQLPQSIEQMIESLNLDEQADEEHDHAIPREFEFLSSHRAIRWPETFIHTIGDNVQALCIDTHVADLPCKVLTYRQDGRHSSINKSVDDCTQAVAGKMKVAASDGQYHRSANPSCRQVTDKSTDRPLAVEDTRPPSHSQSAQPEGGKEKGGLRARHPTLSQVRWYSTTIRQSLPPRHEITESSNADALHLLPQRCARFVRRQHADTHALARQRSRQLKHEYPKQISFEAWEARRQQAHIQIPVELSH